MGIVSKLKKKLLSREIKSEKQIYQELLTQHSFNGSLMFVGDLLRNTAKSMPANIALIEKDRSLTYREFYARAVQLSNVLRLNGVKPRDKVFIYLENSIEFYIAYFGSWLIGAVVIPVNTFLHEKEIAYILHDSLPQVIVTSTSFKSKFDRVVTEGFIAQLPAIITEKDIDWTEPVPLAIEEIAKNDIREVLGESELALLLYTSGTTGAPKGVKLSSRNIVCNTLQSCSRLHKLATPKEKVFAVLPLFHVFAQHTCMWFPVLCGSGAIIVPRIERRHIWDGLLLKPTIFFGFPALYGLLCLMKNAPIQSIKVFISGADALPDKIRSAFSMIYGRKICAGYGLTEASPVVALNPIEGEYPSVQVGYPLAGIECEIRDEQEKVLPVNEVGNLWLRGDNIMLGYHNAPEATDHVLKNGWLNTGDLSSIDKEGKLSIRGRSKDIIIRNGINIYPQEIENVLLTHPSVFKAAVVGQDEAISGQVPIAFVAIKEKREAIESKLRDLCASNLAAYKVPRKIVCLEDLPMNATGKIDKKRLQVM